jgi:hypothetical protein
LILGEENAEVSAMSEPEFKVVAGASDWGSPLSSQPTFKTLEEAEAAAREYIAEQRRGGGPTALGRVVIEETTPDGDVVSHAVA